MMPHIKESGEERSRIDTICRSHIKIYALLQSAQSRIQDEYALADIDIAMQILIEAFMQGKAIVDALVDAKCKLDPDFEQTDMYVEIKKQLQDTNFFESLREEVENEQTVKNSTNRQHHS